MSQYLQEQSDPYVSVFIFTKEGELTFEDEGKTYALLKAPIPVSNRSFSVGGGACRISQKRAGLSVRSERSGQDRPMEGLMGKTGGSAGIILDAENSYVSA